MIIEMSEIRENSLRVIRELGYAVNLNLPLLSFNEFVRSEQEVIDRLLGMYCVAAVAYGFNRQFAVDWLQSNTENDLLTVAERKYLKTGDGSVQEFKLQIEAIWALYWSCGFAENEFSFSRQCPQDFASRLPDVKKNQTTHHFRSQSSLRDISEIVQMADVAYCIHWAYTHASLSGKRILGGLPEYVVRERRHALDWLLEFEDWDAISLDT
jgi:hypothetical protein